MIVVAFLQNLWVKDPEKVKILLEENEENRQRILRRLLFAGGLTGRRIHSAFNDLTPSIIFEECTKEIAGDSKTICKPDPEHIKAVLLKYRPDIVITFGVIAYEAVRQHHTGKLIICPHPAARQSFVKQNLTNAANQLREKIYEVL